MTATRQRKPQARNTRETPEGTERRCSRCTEWWPADGEFFNKGQGNTLQSWCRACMSEARKARQAGQAGAAPAACVG